MKPRRIQLSRKKGWRLPPNTIVVARPTLRGNPYFVCPTRPPKEAVRVYRMGVRGRWKALQTLEGHSDVDMLAVIAYFQRIRRRMAELRGKNLACWCKLCDAHKDGLPLGENCPDCQPCHADVLLEVANA